MRLCEDSLIVIKICLEICFNSLEVLPFSLQLKRAPQLQGAKYIISFGCTAFVNS